VRPASLAAVCVLLADHLALGDTAPNDDLLASGALDSLALVELLFQLEQEFGITLELDEVDPELFRTPESIARLVDGKLGQ